MSTPEKREIDKLIDSMLPQALHPHALDEGPRMTTDFDDLCLAVNPAYTNPWYSEVWESLPDEFKDDFTDLLVQYRDTLFFLGIEIGKRLR